ncbi:hypothetical protein DPMN_048625 [Dreissena polymorpha]|uniref:Uncharacterized protein n=1 Tax=Dreissena polymorpha TaxID=45954 RepID=A0A9D4I0C5_DREPO|nr:hypothetical protein DPMN_048625 [Dreissena polymorpha]
MDCAGLTGYNDFRYKQIGSRLCAQVPEDYCGRRPLFPAAKTQPPLQTLQPRAVSLRVSANDILNPASEK